MQVVIDISEDMYHDVIDGILDLRDSDTRIAVGTWLNMAIPKSILLPKGHGRLIDADNIKTAFPNGEYVRTESVRATIDHEDTIIEADKSESED